MLLIYSRFLFPELHIVQYGGLGTEAIAGIAVAVGLVVFLVLAVLAFRWWKGRWLWSPRRTSHPIVEADARDGGLEVAEQGAAQPVVGVMGRRSANTSRVEMAVPGQLTPQRTGVNGEDAKL